jgi:maltooligosyltrehalose trehalohydrolase
VLTAPFIPMIFQGEEFAASTPFQYFAHHEDAEMARAVSEGRKREFAAFGWAPDDIPDPESAATFERSKLLWSEVRQGEHAEMLAWFKQLIHLRHGSPSLNDGDPSQIHVSYDEDKRWLIMERGQVQVMCNLGDIAIEPTYIEGAALVLASHQDIYVKSERVVLPPNSLAILSTEGL